MAYKIESAQWTIPVTGLQYTDVRPVIAGDTLEDIIEGARSVSKAVGNDKLYERLSGGQMALGGAPVSSQRIMGDGVLFNESDHTYTKDGKPYLSGSTFAHMFEKEFPRDAIAQKVADRDGKDTEDVLAGWDAKGEISLKYGTLIHKCMETYIKYNELPSNEYLKNIVEDWAEQNDHETFQSEVFVQDDAHQLCGVIDLIQGAAILDFKTGDIHQKIQHTLGKEWPSDRLSLYTLQLNFYKYICEQNGEKIKELGIWWLNGEHWEYVKVDIIDIKPYLEQVWKPTK
jgi:hypothetical protein